MKSIVHLNCVILDSQGGGGGVESFQINGASLKNGNLTCAFVCEQKSACDIRIREGRLYTSADSTGTVHVTQDKKADNC